MANSINDIAQESAGHAKRVASKVKEQASNAVSAARDTAQDVAAKTAQGIEGNPLSVLVGGLAVGALLGALVPRSQREKQLFGPVARRIGAGAREAISVARDVGTRELAAAGISRAAASEQVQKLVEGFSTATKRATEAAVQATKGGDQASSKPDT